STNGRAAGGDGRKINYGDADCGSFGCGDETSRAAEREDSRDPRERRASAQPRGSAATGETIRRDSRLESKQIARGAVRERDRRENDVGSSCGPRRGCRCNSDELEDVDLTWRMVEARLSRQRSRRLSTGLARPG